MYNVANQLSYLRIIIVGLGWIIAPIDLQWLAVLFLAAGLTDALDGHIARHYRLESRYGAKLDSIADLIMMLSAFAWVFLYTSLFKSHPLLVSIPILAQILAYFVAIIKFKRIAALHLRSSKIMAWSSYLFIVHALWYGPTVWLLGIASAIMTYSGIDEIRTLLKLKTLDA